MGLDVYVGTLTRYYSRDWETIVQQAARQSGQRVEVHRPTDPADAARDPASIRNIVVTWRDSLSKGLRDHFTTPLDWDESDAAPYFTDKPAWDCYSALLLWAAYEEQTGIRRPQVGLEDWTADPAYQASNAGGFHSRYSQLLHGAELWLPCDFPFTFQAEDAGRNPVAIGSSVALTEQLRVLNERTWRANPTLLGEWRKVGAEHGAPLELGARFAFSIFQALAEQSVRNRLPMKLDY